MNLKIARILLPLCCASIVFCPGININARAQNAPGMTAVERAAAQELVAAANRDRAPEGLAPLRHDSKLEKAAWDHAQTMVSSGKLSHRLPGEPGLIARVRTAGVHASTVAENVAEAPTAEQINDEWMHSPSHRANLLDPRLNAVGVAVVARYGELYAVEDFARETPSLSSAQQERQVAAELRTQKIQVLGDGSRARAYCNGTPQRARPRPRLVMRYSTTDLSHLPTQVVDGIHGGRYHRAAVGACAMSNQNGFAAYQIVILLY